MNMPTAPAWAAERFLHAQRVWLFLDYDGTLASFAPSPEVVAPDLQVIDLVARLCQRPGLRVAVVSGRRLEQVRVLLPVPGIFLAGTYGVELLTPQGERIDRLEYASVRPALDRLKPQWEGLIAGHAGVILEDKGWSLALHARPAGEASNEVLLAAARRAAGELLALPAYRDTFRAHGREGFYEILPAEAGKGQAVEFLLQRFPWPGYVPLYIGDDYNDEPAFEVVKARGGTAVRVGLEAESTRADFRLESPPAVREWLADVFLK